MNDKKSKRPASGPSAVPPKAEPPKPKSAGPPPPPTPPPLRTNGPLAPQLRRVDWWTFGLTALVTLIAYWYTLAPDLTLEDSGELAVASMYAGVPHPPGYPVWTIYTWLFTVLFPVSNMAYRVGFSSAVAGALACGLVGLMVSRGSSLMLEGISIFKDVERRWENGLCLVSGFVAGLLIGFNGFMWSQAVIVEVYTFSVLSLAGVLVFLLRWIYAPHQRRYLYWAFFWFGISFNNHMSLLVVALGLEVAVLLTAPRLGRDLFFWNTIVYLGGLALKNMKIMGILDSMDPNRVNPLFIIYNLIGITSFCFWVWLAFRTRMKVEELVRDLAMICGAGYLLTLFGVITTYVDYFEFKKGLFFLFNMVGVASIGAFIYLIPKTSAFGKEWRGALACGVAWLMGAAFYLYMPLASMSNPPLNWGYPRTVQGFFHAFTRGQYEKINPTSDVLRFLDQIVMYVEGALAEFNLIYVLIGLVPFAFIHKMQKRERCWLIGLTAIYLCLSVFLLILLNPADDRQSRDLNRVFFTASHVMIAMGVGYGVTLLGGLLVARYAQIRQMALIIAAAVTGIALAGTVWTFQETYYGVLRAASLWGLLLAGATAGALLLARHHAPLRILMVIVACMPVHSILSHWSDNEQRDHLFGFWFGHDMFTPPFNGPDGKPIYPEMDRDTVLYGGTDPGRFNPTYMIFCESFIPPHKRRDPAFDRRDVYLITQNALADGTYLNYIRAHYNRSTQIDPPFFSDLVRGPSERQQDKTNFISKLMMPVDNLFLSLGDAIEKRRRTFTSWFEPDHFTDIAGLVAKLKPGPEQDPLSQYLFNRFTKECQNLLTGQGSKEAQAKSLAKELNRLMEKEYQARQILEKDLTALDRRIKNYTEKTNAITARIEVYRKEDDQIYQMERFTHVPLSARTIRFLRQSPASHTLIRLNRILLEEAYPGLIAKSLGGVYPDLEIHTASPAESEKAFRDYLADAQRRLDHDRNFPNEPPQIRPGEDVRIVENRVQVSGQVAVMSINALLTKVIFDANPDHEFYVEESFPLDWMYPHLSPYGIIMKINRNPLPEITQEMADKDHDFWSQFSERAIGNWIRNETSISNICQFVQQVHIRKDYTGFKGDRKFIRDSDSQKAFSKLRSSIAGVYSWRVNNAKTPAEQQRMIQEAEFAFKQAYAFCPYSPEALYRYVQLLSTLGRLDEALLLAKTSFEMDRYNTQIEGLIEQLRSFKRQRDNAAQADGGELARTEAAFAANPTDMNAAMRLVQLYQQAAQNDKAVAVLDRLSSAPQPSPTALLFAAKKYNELLQLPKVELSLQRLLTLLPDNPEAWYDLAGVQAIMQNPTQAMASIQKALEYNRSRLAADPKASNLYPIALEDARFAPLRQKPEFLEILNSLAPPKP